ncbi:MAG TPA: DUF6519 domain-containing protein [Candidatus Binatia bacterium]|nr:DUF6519 domain-containing protein [Candidatus Binatia bacterium]
MANPDIARIGTDWRKRYFATGMQQGRPLMEEDWNENQRLTSEDKRQALLDIVGDSGCPDDGFKIQPPIGTTKNAAQPPVDVLDFTINWGTLYLGGQRLEMLQKGVDPKLGETYRLQSDWLNQDDADKVKPPGDGKTLNTLAYVEAWEQPVTAVEDSEIYERALGGPDTSTRLRMMRRVHLFADGGASQTCHDAWGALSKSWFNAGLGTIGPGGERKVDTTLTVGFTGGVSGDLCNPPVAGGYLGADNQAIRVQIVDTDPVNKNGHFTWGFDDASPVYRVTVATKVGSPAVVTFITTPKDQAHWPLTGMTVELLAWSAALPNNEKLAEIQGALTTVSASFDPTSNTIQVKDDLTQFVNANNGLAWQTRTDHAALDPNNSFFFYLRVWDRGGDITSPPSIPYNLNDANRVPLGTTGLGVTFNSLNGEAVPGDFWVIGARPANPQELIPWLLAKGGAPPHGIRRFYAPLGVVSWTNDGVNVSGTLIDDCRAKFLPLTRLRGCCSVIVGDGITNFGDVTSVQAAVDALPPEGGEVCILPGTYSGAVTIQKKQNVTIQGCERRSILNLGAKDPNPTDPVILIEDSSNIIIRDIAIQATKGPGIAWASPVLQRPRVSNVTLARLEISARDMSAIDGRAGDNIAVEGCRVQIHPLSGNDTIDPKSSIGLSPAIFLLGKQIRVERNDVLVDAAPTRKTPLGGIQIGGHSVDVEIIRNNISGGLGNGITLGSLTYKANGGGRYPGIIIVIDNGGCTNIGSGGGQPGRGGQTPVTDGNLRRVRIVDNRIENMGNDGIATICLYDEFKAHVCILDLMIERNLIEGCVVLPRAEPQGGPLLRARGGIILADADRAWMRENIIVSNGTSVNEPICGIYIQYGSEIDISLNRIAGNGRPAALMTRVAPPKNPTGAGVSPAWGTALGEIGGGIVIDLALVMPISTGSGDTKRVKLLWQAVQDLINQRLNVSPEFANLILAIIENIGVSAGFAARIEENEVLAPSGRALEIVASGEVSVHGNSFAAVPSRFFDIQGTLQGQPPRRPLDYLGGATVAILNLGVSHELLSNIFGFALMAQLDKQFDPAVTATKDLLPHLAGGDILFHDNQIELGLANEFRAITVSSVLLLSPDDVSMQDNQCNVVNNLFAQDVVLFDAFLIGISTRMIANRMKEVWALLSGLTIGFFFNTTNDNQGTYCFLALGSMVVNPPFGSDNLSLVGGAICNTAVPRIKGNVVLLSQ